MDSTLKTILLQSELDAVRLWHELFALLETRRPGITELEGGANAGTAISGLGWASGLVAQVLTEGEKARGQAIVLSMWEIANRPGGWCQVRKALAMVRGARLLTGGQQDGVERQTTLPDADGA